MKKPIRLTYSTVTEESAEHGDHATHGFVTRNLTIPDRNNMPKNPAQFSLREAIEFCQEHASMRVQADSCPISLRCPNCGEIGIRSVIVIRKEPKCYRWNHGRKPSFMPGVFQAIECIVSFEKAGSRP